MIGKFSNFQLLPKCILYIWMKYIIIYDKTYKITCASSSGPGPFPAHSNLIHSVLFKDQRPEPGAKGSLQPFLHLYTCKNF